MNETSAGSAGADDRAGSPGGGSGEQSPLQTRAAFFKNWSWELVVGLNRAACARGSAQHGPNPQIGDTCQRRWEEARLTELSLLEVLDFLREQHKSAPFLFFNGNTFADLGPVAHFVELLVIHSGDRLEIEDDDRHFGPLDHGQDGGAQVMEPSYQTGKGGADKTLGWMA